jgi:hypothetical protein
MFDEPKRVSLVQEYVDPKHENNYLKFIGDSQNKSTPQEETTLLCYFHEFSDGHETYFLLHHEKLRPQQCVVEGMVIPMTDDVTMGTTMKLGTVKKLILSNTIQLTEKDYSEKEVKEIVKDWDRETLMQILFGKYRHPPLFEDMIAAWMFSGKNGGYPIHFFMLGPNATGKTWMLKSLSTQVPYKEPGYFFDGAPSTILGLVPSFSSKTVSPGEFIKAYRVFYMDEFLKCVARSGGKDKGGDALLPLCSILEHRSSVVASGNTQPVSIIATAKGMFIGNPEREFTDLMDCAEKLSQPVMARFLSYTQTEEHKKFIQERMPEIAALPPEECLPQKNSEMLNIFDFCYKRPSLADFKKVSDIRDRLIDIVPEKLIEMYRGRYYHHINCLVDGVSKTRFLTNEKDTLKYEEEDYAKAEAIMWMVVSSWDKGMRVTQLPIWARQDHLYSKERDLFELIKKVDGDLREEDIADKGTLEKLKQWDLVVIKNNKVYAYNHNEVWNTQKKIIDI